MDLPQLRNGSRATVGLFQRIGPDGRMYVLAVVKQLWAVARDGRLAPIDGAALRVVDEPWDPDSPETSSIRLPNDLALRKPGTDVIVVGEAVAPARRPVPTLDVLVRVGSVERSLRVTGTRVWQKGGIGGLSLSPPEPFTTVPLKWELAYGGFDDSDPTGVVEEARNPVGRGIVKDVASLVHQPGPQIESPTEPIKSPKSRVAPIGVGAIGPSWEPRRRWAGTRDARWQHELMPIPPHDYDPRFEQAAPPELVATPHLRGGERVSLSGMTAEGALDFSLPEVRYFVGAHGPEGLHEERAVLDTVVLFPSDRRVETTVRAAFRIPRVPSDLRAIQVHEKVIR